VAEISKEEYLEALESSGLTGHPGGIAGTEELIRWLDIRRGERVLDLGCGTGYTTSLVAKRLGATVVAADLRPKMLRWAKRRAAREHVIDAVRLVAADAHCLPFRDASFDAAVVESVLVFCDVPAALTELFRVLKPGGRLGCNEITAIGNITHEQEERLAASVGIAPLVRTADEWSRAIIDAGFADVSAEVKPVRWLDVSLFTPLRTDGLRRYLDALLRSLTDPKIRKMSRGKKSFLSSGLLSHLGSGIYRARKPLTTPLLPAPSSVATTIAYNDCQ
jgi:ubiquinone/menaquinone biosynthesis C-methylase UbiE